jgi:hypothetical protein
MDPDCFAQDEEGAVGGGLVTGIQVVSRYLGGSSERPGRTEAAGSARKPRQRKQTSSMVSLG